MRQISALFLGAIFIGAAQTAARAADFSDPKKTVETFISAILGDDANAIKNCYTSADPDRQGMIDGLANMIAASNHLLATATDKFGDNGKTILGHKPGGELIGEGLEIFKSGDEKIEDDVATLTAKPNKPGASVPTPLYFKKVGGDWKFDWDKQTQGMNMQGSASTFSAMGINAQAMNDTADDIRAGKYKTVDDAKAGMEEKLRVASAPKSPQTRSGNP